jgi:hypothetical protein
MENTQRRRDAEGFLYRRSYQQPSTATTHNNIFKQEEQKINAITAEHVPPSKRGFSSLHPSTSSFAFN